MHKDDLTIQERNREIGKILKEARISSRMSISNCAKLAGTSRKRYTSMERGETMIGIAELEVLMQHLNISTHKVWRSPAERFKDQVLIPFTPGKPIQVVFLAQE